MRPIYAISGGVSKFAKARPDLDLRNAKLKPTDVTFVPA